MNRQRKNQKKPQRKANKSKSTSTSISSSGKVKQRVRLSPCANDYAKTLADPFSATSACIPSYPPLLTRKMQVFVKGVISTGSTGAGMIYADPLNAIANDTPCIWYSTSAYTANIFAAQSFNSVSANSNSEYTASAVGTGPNQLSCRVVSSGLRIRYIGTELNRGGQIVAFHDPTHSTLNQRSLASVDGEQESRRLPVSKEWSTVLYRPVDDPDNEFTSTLHNANTQDDGSFFMGIIFQAPGVQSDYEFEFYVNFEVHGRNVRGKTPSHVDVTGHGAVVASLISSPVMAPNQVPAPMRSKNFLEQVESYAADAFTWVVHEAGEIVKPLAKAGIAALLA
jgi:hypothetical protein